MSNVEWVLLEREGETITVAEMVKDVTQGSGRVVVIEGAAGVGKTRLLAEVRAAGLEAGAGVVSARGLDLEREFPFGVLRQLFEPLLARADTEGQEALWAGPAGQARGVLSRVDPAAGPKGDFAVLHGLLWLTMNACQERPLVMLVDDLQWCDVPSLRYLVHLLSSIEDLSVLVAAAVRTGEPGAQGHLVQQITTDRTVQVLPLGPLSRQATDALLRQALPGAVDGSFVEACHRVTGGNPLLLRELAHTIVAEGITADGGQAEQLLDLGPRAVAPLVALRMYHLSEQAKALARAVAVLGGHTKLTTAAALAGQDPISVLEAVTQLEQLEILRVEDDAASRLAFVHPLVQAAVYDSVGLAERADAHRRAARLLTSVDIEPEQAAAHLMRVPPSGDRETITMLRAAAAAAAGRGAPDSAHTYLSRCLDELSTGDERLQVLQQAGRVALLIDTAAAVDHYRQAYNLAQNDSVSRARIAIQYASALLYTGQIDECEQVATDGIALLPEQEQDLRRQLQAWLVIIVNNLPGHDRTRHHVTDLRHLPPHDSPGGRMLDCAIAVQQANSGDPDAVPRARHALRGGPMFEIAANFTNCAWWTLLSAGAEDIVDVISAESDQNHRRGDTAAQGGVHMMRGKAWLYRGQLADAAADLHECLRLLQLIGLTVATGVVVPALAECLMEQGRLREAADLLDQFTDGAHITPFFLASRAQLLFLEGEYEQAVQAALTCKEQAAEIDLINPEIISWRTWAALSLHHLDRTRQARTIATEDLYLARRWGAPHALGRALRINGLLHDGTEQVDMLQQAVTILENSNARLEHAKALADYGAALRRAGHPAKARTPLRQSLDLASHCGAPELAATIRTELAAAGGRSRRTALSGPDALTPSEQRVAELAATGATNRQIAQRLYVTPKTVEVHLSATYRKLGITTRTQLTPQTITDNP
ncbi:AAA family ATPase [Streptomyces virginiae]|uniref:helix-turn-helix transcriptional regulator n=1 Tax=Streptomyces virginiae TaxID=1961 RepID=UPI0036CA0594